MGERTRNATKAVLDAWKQSEETAYAKGFKAGQDAMRARAAEEAQDWYDSHDPSSHIVPMVAAAIKALPIEEPK